MNPKQTKSVKKMAEMNINILKKKRKRKKKKLLKTKTKRNLKENQKEILHVFLAFENVTASLIFWYNQLKL